MSVKNTTKNLKRTKDIESLDKGEITKIILKTLFGIGVVIAIITLPGIAHIVKLFEKDKKYKYRFNRSLKSLEKRGLIKLEEKDGTTTVEITENGKKKVLKYDFDDIKIKKTKKWDKKWRLVMFDIPENLKLARESIRFKFRELGFVQYQKSVFIYPYKCKREIDFISTYFFVTKYVKYITADKIEDEVKLKKLFKLH